MASVTETRCPKCGSYAEFHTDGGATYCQKEVTQMMRPGEKQYRPQGGGCGAVTRSLKYAPPVYRGGQ